MNNSGKNVVNNTNKLQIELDSNYNIIKSIKVAHNTLHDLIEDKDKIIPSQKTII